MIHRYTSRFILLCSLIFVSVHAEQVARAPQAATTNNTKTALNKPAAPLPKSMALETIHGAATVTDAVIIELLHHKAITRLKGVDQHGPTQQLFNLPTFSRYDHSVGVYVLLKKFGAPLVVQVAGLLHDASHTIFSHLADRFFKTGTEVAYQDRIHAWYLEQMGVDKVLEKHGFDVDMIMPEQYRSLKSKKMSVSADRLDYILRTASIFNRLSKEEITKILSDIRLEDDTWFFTSSVSAKTFAEQGIHFTKTLWSSPENLAHHHWMVSAVRQLIARELITFDTVHFGQDEDALKHMRNGSDSHIAEMVEKCRNAKDHFTVVTNTMDYDVSEHPKLRSCSPLVLQKDGTKALLVDIDADFKKEMDSAKRYCARGTKLKLVYPSK